LKINAILDQIDMGGMALPEFQRGYVWNRDQVVGLLNSLYRGHPVGGLLVWVTTTDVASDARTRGETALPPGTVKLLLDGQQRITTLYGIIRGEPPRFFDGNAEAFSNLYFHLDDEVFARYQRQRMADDPLWISVTDLMQQGVGQFIQRFVTDSEMQPHLQMYLDRLNRIDSIKEIDLHIEEVTGADKTVDVVVDIFNRVNSGGTKLSKGDLALAKICATLPEARDEMKERLETWRGHGYHFKLEWLLRCINTLLTGEALFSALADVSADDFRDGLLRAERRIEYLLNTIGSRLGLDHDRVLGSRYSFPLMVRYLDDKGGLIADPKERDKLLYWYVNSFLWGRYAGSTETFLNRDLAAIDGPDGSLDRLIGELRQTRGSLELSPEDFAGYSRGARFYPMLYMLTRTWKARDWDTGNELASHMLGRMASLELHHIFPKALLYEAGYELAQVNALANFTFLTKETNLRVSARDPAEYLAEFVDRDPDLIASHRIPTDPELWRIEKYPDFLAARRELLATAANEFMHSLLHGEMPETAADQVLSDGNETHRSPITVQGAGIATEDEESLIIDANQWVIDNGLPEGEMLFEVAEPDSGDAIVLLDLAWPDGLQEGLSQPVAVMIDESREAIGAAVEAGYRCFADVDRFKAYVRSEILAAEAA
jgi:hypothetical protein